jgi:3-oxoacyl-[acyl-carrier-protein] synthase II
MMDNSQTPDRNRAPHGLPVIRRWSAVSAYGTGREPFADGVRAGLAAPLAPVPDGWRAAEASARFIADFDATKTLGSKGTRTLDRLTTFAVAAARGVLEEDLAACPPERTALVLGTNGSTDSMMRQTRTSLTSVKPFFIDAARIPSSVMNCAASRCAIWFGLNGPNATVTAGRVAALCALGYAGRVLRSGRADRVLCGAAEEYGHARSWVERQARAEGSGAGAPPGEGAVVFSLEASSGPDSRTAPALAEVAGVRHWIGDGEPCANDVRGCVERLLATCGIETSQVWAAAGSGVLPSEAEALTDLFGDEVVGRVRTSELVGDTGAVAGAFQLAAVLSRSRDEDVAGRVALVTSVDPVGHVAAAALRLGSPGSA